MKGRQMKRLLSYLTTGQVFREHIAIIGTVPGTMRTIRQFDELLLTILENMYKQSEPTKQYALEKKALRIKLVKHAVLLSGLAYNYSIDTNNQVLQYRFNKSFTSIFRMWGPDVYIACSNIYNELVIIQEELRPYGIKKKDIELLFELKEQFYKNIARPRMGIIGRKMETRSLKENLNAAGKLLNEQTDRMMPYFEQYRDFHSAYMASRKQVQYGRPKMSLEKKIEQFYTAPKVSKRVSKKKSAARVLEEVVVG